MSKKNDKSWYLLAVVTSDLDLLTLKAVRILKKADVILYDEQINPEILNFASRECLKLTATAVFQGVDGLKTDALPDLALELENKDRVVRLKAGEPFFSSRYREEFSLARRIGFVTHYIPGVSQMQALGRFRIPLTHRGISDGIWVLQGADPGPGFLKELRIALHTRSTLVIYGGVHRVECIERVACLCQKGDTPVAVVQERLSGEQDLFFTSLAGLKDVVVENAIPAEAMLVIGDVIGLGKSRWECVGHLGSLKREVKVDDPLFPAAANFIIKP